MPEAAQIGLFIHIMGVAVLAGGLAVSLSTFAMMRRATSVQELRVWSGLGRILSQYQVLPAAAVVLILSGGYLVDKAGEEWSEGWIGLSAVAVIVATVIGLLLITPRLKAIGMAVGPAPDGPVPQSITDQLNEPMLVAAIHGNAMTAVAIAWNMTTRPNAIGALLAVVVLAAVGVAAAYPAYQQQKA